MNLDLHRCKVLEKTAQYRVRTKEYQDQLKNIYENRVYELDTFRSILCRVNGLDYRFLREQLPADFEDLTNTQIRHFDGIFTKKCKKCNSLKAPQSHHCSTCGRCVARMDHHCPWVNNCVGYAN